MLIAFSVAAVVALAASVRMVTCARAMHALLYLVVSLLASSVMFLLLGAPFAAALEVIIYAGAIMILIVFAVMLLNIGPQAAARERTWMPAAIWVGPTLLALILAVELGYLLVANPVSGLPHGVPPEEIGMALFGPYVVGTELAAFLLLAGLVGAYHLGRAPSREGLDDG